MDRKLLIVGGHPKGHPVPFSEETLSGKRLRPLIRASPYRVEVMDLWADQKAEDGGIIDSLTLMILNRRLDDGWEILAAGRWVYETLQGYGIPSTYVRHPAARAADPMASWRAVLLPGLVIDAQRFSSIDRRLRDAMESDRPEDAWLRVKELARKNGVGLEMLLAMHEDEWLRAKESIALSTARELGRKKRP